jgi:hypothetical protein
VHLRTIGFCLAVLVSTGACENSAGTLIGIGGQGGGAITQTQAAGDWSFTVRKTTTLACSGGSLADGQVLTVHMDVLSDGSLNATTSSWQNPPTTVIRPLSGSVRFTDGFADLFLSSATGSASGMELRGTIGSNGTFSGTLTDPAPGFSPMFSAGGCEYSTNGTKS